MLIVYSSFLAPLTSHFWNQTFCFFGHSFIDWNAACEGQFPSVYCPLELNDYNAFPEGKSCLDRPSAVLLFPESQSRRGVDFRHQLRKCALTVSLLIFQEPGDLRWVQLGTPAICLFFFSRACGIWEFLGQRSNHINHSSDNTGSLTHWATRELLFFLFTSDPLHLLSHHQPPLCHCHPPVYSLYLWDFFLPF